MTRPVKLTPMLEQYFEIKRQVPDAILLYRLGDFYEMFFEDAERAAPILDLVLTARGKGGESEAPMCGVPFHAADQYVAKLIRHGFRVALCEQVGDPSATKGIVRREIVRIVTPGTAVEGSILDRDSCYLLTVAPAVSGAMGAAFLDVSTGDFFVTAYEHPDDAKLFDDVARLSPREIVLAAGLPANVRASFERFGVPVTEVEESFFEPVRAHADLARQFGTQSLRGFGLEEGDRRTGAAGAALRYASSSRRQELAHVRAIRVENDGEYLQIDASSLENLEIFDSRDSSRPRASLWSVLNQTRNAMGSRVLRRWLARPLRNHERIFARHDAVDELTRNRILLGSLTTTLATLSDLERIISRVAVKLVTPRECLALASSLLAVGEMREMLATARGPLLGAIRDRLDPIPSVVDRIRTTLDEEPAASPRDGGVIRAGVDPELDSLREIARDSKSVLLRIEAAERERTGISSLKVRFNSVFGYYIEISKANLARVPVDYIRKQTLVNAERFITPELKVLEEKIVGAEEKSTAIEVALYERMLEDLAAEATAVLGTAAAAGELDAIASLASVAVRHRYVRPSLSDATSICIEEGRHPVIETLSTERFIPNDTRIVRGENEIQLITGPNMGGKSTYLRQVALIVVMAQAGSFVPAARVELGIFDRVFTRVGASDHLARGESTFMVEMHETANILNNATPRSLIILDEVGRGTATFDGLSLAWAIIEFLHDTPERNAITLFATHYHEVTDLARTKPRIANLSVSVKEWNDQIIFLRKVIEGAADKSYGIQVAKLAGLPASVIRRARELLVTLERKEQAVVEEAERGAPAEVTRQLSLFDTREQDVLRALRMMSVDSMSPIEALNQLDQLKRRLDGVS